MSIELSAEQESNLYETRRIDTPSEFQLLLGLAGSEMSRLGRQASPPNQPITTTLVEMRDLYLTVKTHAAKLAAKNYGPERLSLFRDGIRLVDTAAAWFQEGGRTGAFRSRTFDETVKASRPWRERIAAIGRAALWDKPELAVAFEDVNSTGTIKEEVEDLEMMTSAVAMHRVTLDAEGLTEQLVLEGKTLLAQARGRDLLGILGLRNEEEGRTLRNEILTYATMLANEARAKGINACFDDAVAKARFEAATFRNAVKRLKPRRRGASGEETSEEGETVAVVPEGDAKTDPAKLPD